MAFILKEISAQLCDKKKFIFHIWNLWLFLNSYLLAKLGKNYIKAEFPTFLAPGTDFVEENFSVDGRGG